MCFFILKFDGTQYENMDSISIIPKMSRDSIVVYPKTTRDSIRYKRLHWNSVRIQPQNI